MVWESGRVGGKAMRILWVILLITAATGALTTLDLVQGVAWQLTKLTFGEWGATAIAVGTRVAAEGLMGWTQWMLQGFLMGLGLELSRPEPLALPAPGWAMAPSAQNVTTALAAITVLTGTFRFIKWAVWLVRALLRLGNFCAAVTALGHIVLWLLGCCCGRATDTKGVPPAAEEPEHVPEQMLPVEAGGLPPSPPLPLPAAVPQATAPPEPLVQSGKYRGSPYASTLNDRTYLQMLETRASHQGLRPGCMAVLAYRDWHTHYHAVAVAAGSAA